MSKSSIELVEKFKSSGQKFNMEIMPTRDGDLYVFLFEHATLGFVWNGKVVYVDPLSEYADFSKLPKADVVLVTHEHYDHLDKEAVNKLYMDKTVVLGSLQVSVECTAAKLIKHGETVRVTPVLTVTAVPAYNVSESQLQFHPRERKDNGYLVGFGDTVVYISGDTEPIPEMKKLGRVDIAFLPVNQPYTMNLEQAVEAVATIKPEVFFPIHTTDTEIEPLKKMVEDCCDVDVRIHPMP